MAIEVCTNPTESEAVQNLKTQENFIKEKVLEAQKEAAINRKALGEILALKTHATIPNQLDQVSDLIWECSSNSKENINSFIKSVLDAFPYEIQVWLEKELSERIVKKQIEIVSKLKIKANNLDRQIQDPETTPQAEAPSQSTSPRAALKNKPLTQADIFTNKQSPISLSNVQISDADLTKEGISTTDLTEIQKLADEAIRQVLNDYVIKNHLPTFDVFKRKIWEKMRGGRDGELAKILNSTNIFTTNLFKSPNTPSASLQPSAPNPEGSISTTGKKEISIRTQEELFDIVMSKGKLKEQYDNFAKELLRKKYFNIKPEDLDEKLERWQENKLVQHKKLDAEDITDSEFEKEKCRVEKLLRTVDEEEYKSWDNIPSDHSAYASYVKDGGLDDFGEFMEKRKAKENMWTKVMRWFSAFGKVSNLWENFGKEKDEIKTDGQKLIDKLPKNRKEALGIEEDIEEETENTSQKETKKLPPNLNITDASGSKIDPDNLSEDETTTITNYVEKNPNMIHLLSLGLKLNDIDFIFKVSEKEKAEGVELYKTFVIGKELIKIDPDGIGEETFTYKELEDNKKMESFLELLNDVKKTEEVAIDKLSSETEKDSKSEEPPESSEKEKTSIESLAKEIGIPEDKLEKILETDRSTFIRTEGISWNIWEELITAKNNLYIASKLKFSAPTFYKWIEDSENGKEFMESEFKTLKEWMDNR